MIDSSIVVISLVMLVGFVGLVLFRIWRNTFFKKDEVVAAVDEALKDDKKD